MEKQAARRLSSLVSAAQELVLERRGADVEVNDIAYDSRRVQPGALFFCIPGLRNDGHQFAAEAVDAGAAALCVERPLDVAAPQVVATDARKAMARIAGAFFGDPAGDLMLLGVTGTNGKTTTAFLLESVLRAAGYTTGLIGTIETRIAAETRKGVRTTPESVDLQRLLADMRAANVDAVAMEVTSHGLALHRVEGLCFQAAAFTNLSQDHLDFHASMEDYFAAKRSLFTPARARRAAVNADDPWGRRLLEEAAVPMLGFGLGADAQARADRIRSGPWGSEFVMIVPDDEIKLTTSLVGRFNISNCLAAATTALQAGLDRSAVEAGIRDVRSVPGRFEAISSGQPFTVVVDYAHTPDSLDNVLRGARSVAARGRVLCVFGCGGDRDRRKRPLMGAVAARLADVVVVTSDNPRSEDPQAIIDEILEGVIAERSDGPDAVFPDRRQAIAHALATAREDDVVVVAGKGHETGQEFADGVVPFDDRDVAREELELLGFKDIEAMS